MDSVSLSKWEDREAFFPEPGQSPPEFTETAQSFTGDFAVRANEEEVSVLSAINDHYSLSRSEIEKVTNFSRKRSLNIINSLKERKIIEQVGRSSSTKYRISRNHMTNNQALINMLQHTINLLQRNR